MDLREYMSVRRAYNVVRQTLPSEERLTFEELAILCRLEELNTPTKTSAIAEYQGALRPTMTHRTNHLVELGLISRGEGNLDRRNVVCSITDRGHECVAHLCSLICENIPLGQPLSRTTPERIARYVDAMGSVFVRAGDMVLLFLSMSEGESCSITTLVDALGLLQPTVSMSVNSLDDAGLIERRREGTRTLSLSLTKAGKEQAALIASSINAIVVRRRRRGSSKQ